MHHYRGSLSLPPSDHPLSILYLLGQSKLANILFTYELSKRLASNPNITVNCLHPGVVKTELGR